MISISTLIISACLAVFSVWLFADYFILWRAKIKSHFVWNEMDIYWSLVCLLPILLGHFITIWGNYFRATNHFQHSISKVTTPATEKQRISFWERHDSYFGYTTKFWWLVGLVVTMNIYWFILTTVLSRDAYVETYGYIQGNLRSIAYGSSQAVLLDTSLILFLVLRRSMLHALGFTYPEIIPLHRWLGVSMLVWSTIHVAFYSAWLIMEGKFVSDIAFTDKSRGTRNMPGVFAWIGVVIMSFFALPQFRRWVYPVFVYVHRAGTFVFFIGLIMHYPSYMLWYYMLPGFILFLIDRFVPRIIQARTIDPMATCALNTDADIIRVKFTSPEPMKPYYPGDYITVQIPGMGQIFHPFTIASYWPEDPYSMTLYMRVFNDSKWSWTKKLSERCGTDDRPILIHTNVEGVFGDRRHDYLKSETMVIFVAGAAITTFMALIKAVAAQIAASNDPLRMQLHLVCTFRTRSELHAYGSFLHQITRDPRFTSWLHVQIFVSRPDKPKTLMGAHAYVVKNDIQVPSQIKKKDGKNFLQRTGTRLKRALSGRTAVNAPAPIMTSVVVENAGESLERFSSAKPTAETLDDMKRNPSIAAVMIDPSSMSPSSSPSIEINPISEKPSRAMTYHDQALPTFQASNADAVSKRLALLDLFTSALLVLVPMAFYYGMRAARFEGQPQWCLTTKSKDKWTIFVCHWTNALVPGLVHTIAMLALGYFGIAVAKKIHMRHHQCASNNIAKDIEISGAHSEKQSVEGGNWDEGDVVYTRGRMDVRKQIQALVDQGVGMKENGEGLTTVFAGGPEGFVNMIENQVKKAAWVVDFNRETWAP
ncbi:hypothetical protein BX616_010798 [Lobosporangium transversale]|uniref:FAD-binding FR-type domain-containing protein n=1 Tax=Lobosporangium transversale TaxID=64571 RepID=A0A1Y2GFB0_9FUNG|nr:hypothetical protein BCR41DRAFT_388860 [Lobosporangium transversale]KAF9910686.1 hypothetical protein BX616_010798 [Lobosporangium transversale]ORZ07484.1 hypothetical protein BCR41DRAFT_388860 [Lobosporangium transversale]|eukprot:XP_021877991.1 hypothetical protein BCR41DRAFT_388860 [Lobosporangium transversale]